MTVKEEEERREPDELDIEEEMMEAAERKEKKTKKKKKARRRAVVEEVEEVVDEDEEEINEMVQELQDNALSKLGRGPGVPTSRERRNRDIVNQSQGQGKINWSVPNVDYSEPKNPRNSNRPGAVSSRRRMKKWKARERFGIKQRRPVIDRHGKDTGATTSSLG